MSRLNDEIRLLREKLAQQGERVSGPHCITSAGKEYIYVSRICLITRGTSEEQAV